LCAGALFVAVWLIALAMAGALRSAPEFAASVGLPLALSVLVSAGSLTNSLWGIER